MNLFKAGRHLVLAWLSACLLIACGGGTGNASSPAVPPTANAGVAQTVLAGAGVALDGSASTDAESASLTYSWTLTSKPAGSAAALTNASTAKPLLGTDVAGS